MKNRLYTFRFLFSVVTLFCIINTALAESSEIYIPASNPLVKLSIIDDGEDSFNSAQKNSIIEAVKIWTNVIKNPQQAATFKVIADSNPELVFKNAGVTDLLVSSNLC